jgi:hypothetical protein
VKRELLAIEHDEAEDRCHFRQARGRSATRASSSEAAAAASTRFRATLRQRDAEAGVLFRLRSQGGR